MVSTRNLALTGLDSLDSSYSDEQILVDRYRLNQRAIRIGAKASAEAEAFLFLAICRTAAASPIIRSKKPSRLEIGNAKIYDLISFP